MTGCSTMADAHEPVEVLVLCVLYFNVFDYRVIWMLKVITPRLTSDLDERIALRRIRTLLSLIITEQRRKLVLPRIIMRC